MSVATKHRGEARKPTYDRSKNDWYVEPRWCVEALLDNVRFVGTVWDPACGLGTITKVCDDRGLRSLGSDINPQAPWFLELDFLDHTPSYVDFPADNVIMNPPFKVAVQFVEHGLEVAQHKVAILQRLAFLESLKRAEFFQTTPLAKLLVMTSRVSCPPGDIAAEGLAKDPDWESSGGAVAYAWFIWDHDHEGPATIGWAGRPDK